MHSHWVSPAGKCDVTAGLGISEQCEAVPVQVTFPSWLDGTPDSPEAKLKWIIRACLHVRLQDRWLSDQVHVALHEIMVQHGWSDNMQDT